jgi:arabinogalactan endo-1,4-beta-galactosidase
MPALRTTLLFLLGLLPAAAGATASPQPDHIRGADVSSLPKAEALGARFYDADGKAGDPLRILRDQGVNTLRLRVWVLSPDGYHNAAHILPLARRARDLGLRLLIDFHYSDTWADPAHQAKPAAWRDLPFDALVSAVYDHTHAFCHALAAQGTPADYVQIGNEINDGLLWPDGRITGRGADEFAPLARLLNAGIRGVRSAHAATRIALHLGTSTEDSLLRWWFDGVRSAGVDWDVTAVSYYAYLHGPTSKLATSLGILAERYQRPVLVMETAYPFTLENADAQSNIAGDTGKLLDAYPATPEGQAAFMRDVFAVSRAVPDGRGAGVVYWEPLWLATPGNGWDNRDPQSGNGWENMALFDFSGRALPALKAFAPPVASETENQAAPR